MKNSDQSKKSFQLSGKSPSDFQRYARGNEELRCADIAYSLGESDMRFILARRHQLGMQAIEDAYAVVKDYVRNGKCHDRRRLFNFLLTKKLAERRIK